MAKQFFVTDDVEMVHEFNDKSRAHQKKPIGSRYVLSAEVCEFGQDGKYPGSWYYCIKGKEGQLVKYYTDTDLSLVFAGSF